MATIRFNNLTINSLMNGNIAGAPLSNANSTQASHLSGGSASTSLLIIYKGTQENFATFTDRSTRASDVLITFTLAGTTASFTDLGQINIGLANAARSYKMGIALANQAASATGTAAWFMICRSGTTSLTDKGAMMGSVGVTGSGADLEIPSTSIVAGTNYQSNGVYFNFPQNWTV